MRVAAEKYLKLFISINETLSCVSALAMSTILVSEKLIAFKNVDDVMFLELIWNSQ